MNKLLMVNSLIKYRNSNVTERILWVDSRNTLAITIDINSNTCPKKIYIEDIIYDIRSGDVEILKNDPWARSIKEEDIDKKDKEKRDKAWEIICTLVDGSEEPKIFIPKKRAELIAKVSTIYGVTDKTIYKYVKRFWQRGKNINALLPDYYKCGGIGKEKTAGEVKLGRPKVFKDILGDGVNVTEDTKKIFRIALAKYYYNTKQNPLTIVYELMRRDFYSEDFKITNGIRVPILKSSCEVPSFNQFKYFFQKEREIRKEISTRKSAKKYLLQNRAILGNSTVEAIGPGSIYQIDATIADVYLVSRYNRNWIIGRPVVYFVIDLFSRSITGLYVGLEGPSWVGAMMALANSAMNKVEYCRQYDIEISEDEWSMQYLPDTIWADRGEMESNMAENMISALHIKIQNMASFRGEQKAVIERFFKTVNTHVKPFLPGFINEDFKTRGSRDYRLDGTLDSFQFTQIMIKIILYHNNHSWLTNYNREEMMISDDIECIPRKLWEWGIANRAGKLRSLPEEIVKLNLMPEGNATINARGIKFRNMYYSSKEALIRKDFEKARNFGSWKIKVSFDPRNMNNIYIRSADGKKFEQCFLLEHQERYLNKTIEEIEYLTLYEKLEKQKNDDTLIQSKSDLMADIETIVKNAEKETKEAQVKGESKKRKIESIRENRKIEKLLNRETEAFELNKISNGMAQVIPIKESNEDKDNSNEDIEILRRKQRERINGKNE